MPFERLDDRTMLFDALVSDKHEAGDYNIRASETSNKQLLDLFQSIHDEEQVHVHLFMDAMSQHGWESPLQANPQDVSTVQNQGRAQSQQIGQKTLQTPNPAATAPGNAAGATWGAPPRT